MRNNKSKLLEFIEKNFSNQNKLVIEVLLHILGIILDNLFD